MMGKMRTRQADPYAFEENSDIDDPQPRPEKNGKAKLAPIFSTQPASKKRKILPQKPSDQQPSHSRESTSRSSVEPLTLTQPVPQSSSSTASTVSQPVPLSSSSSIASTVNQEGNKFTKILDGNFFEVLHCDANGNVKALCLLCKPEKKVIKGHRITNSNFMKHFKRKHPESFKKYEDSRQVSSLKQTPLDFSGKRISQAQFETRILDFLIDTMSAIALIEKETFINMFAGLNVDIMTRKTAMRKIAEKFRKQKEEIISLLNTIQYLCATADIWSARRRSFLGVTIHWINENFSRGSAALACTRFKGTHDYINTGTKLQEIFSEYQIEERIVSTVTDNGSNFLKAFRLFGKNPTTSDTEDENDEDEESDAEEEIEFPELNLEEDANLMNISLSKHERCACHNFNLIGKKDAQDAINANPAVKRRHEETLHKCSLLWAKARRPKSAEIVQQTLGHTLSFPGQTRWNSYYDAFVAILKCRNKLEGLCLNLKLQPFKEIELDYLQEYVVVMKPLAELLDFFQGEKNSFYGQLLPGLISLQNKYDKLKETTFKYGGKILLEGCVKGLTTRYKKILDLGYEAEEAKVAAACHPEFKLRWVTTKVQEKTDYTVTPELMKELIVRKAENNFATPSEDEKVQNSSSTKNPLFDFDEDSGDSQESNEDSQKSKIKIEVLKYFEDPRTNLEMLNDYPAVKKLFFKYNTTLPSSAAVERLFSFATIINVPKRHKLSDENFEHLVLLKGNKQFGKQ